MTRETGVGVVCGGEQVRQVAEWSGSVRTLHSERRAKVG